MSQLLVSIGITKTHNRPYTSNDNSFSESQFRTLKYCQEFPGQFLNIDDAEKFSQKFFTWYNNKHYYSGIAWLTPESVRYGYAENILECRHNAILQAYFKNPMRFNNKIPELKKLESAVYINPLQIVKIKLENLEKNYRQEEITLAG